MVLHLSRALQKLRITLLIACNHFFFHKFVMNNLIWSYKLFLLLWSGKAYQSNVCVFIFPTEFPVYRKTKWTSFKVVSCKMQAFSSFSALFLTVTSFCLSQQQSFRFLPGNSHTYLIQQFLYNNCMRNFLYDNIPLDGSEHFQRNSI